jgi:predicted aspartyl protease
MKRFLLLCGALLVLGCAGQKSADAASLQSYLHVKRLLDSKDFFRARDAVAAKDIKLSPYHRLILEAGITNGFNKPAVSNSKIDKLLTDYKSLLKDSITLELLKLKQANHARLFQYSEALSVTNEILEKYAGIMGKEDIDDIANTGKIWQALEHQPKQDVIIQGNTVIQMTRDKAQLANLMVSSGNIETAFIFDTGANLSTVTRSTAVKLNMKMLGGLIEVNSITGGKITAGMALCPQFTMGNIVVKNAVFLVLEDDALAFPQIEYQINGILGFPVIEALKEIQITANDEFIVPEKRTVNPSQNMALEFLTPVIDINGEYYSFDTGATATALYSKYLEKHKSEITGKYDETTLQFGGAGGMTKKKGYNIPFNPVINGKKITIPNVQLYIEEGNDKEKFFYGNIGQDLIKQFPKMTINFESMFIRFE